MLNHIWLAILVIGILTAAGRDIHDAVSNSYGNGTAVHIGAAGMQDVTGPGKYQTNLTLSAQEMRRSIPALAQQQSDCSFIADVTMFDASRGTALLTIPPGAPEVLEVMATAQGGDRLIGSLLRRDTPQGPVWSIVLQPVRLVYLRKITIAAFDAATLAVQIAIGLIGIMALWLGVMNVAQEAGLVTLLSRAVRPLTQRLFPDVPSDHPAIAAIMMNISANMLGLGNAATPFGLKAMEELEKVNTHKGTASNAMCTFLAMNTSCVTLIPATAIAVRASLGSSNPAAIIGTTLLASLVAASTGVAVAKLLQRLPWFRLPAEAAR